MFTRVSKTKTLVVGSLESDMGSEFLFGYDPARGLKWLERHGKEYTAADPEWHEAVSLITRGDQPPARQAPEPPPTYMEAEAPEMAEVAAQPATVTRSSSSEGWEDPYPMEADDSRIVGDHSTEGIDVPDDDIAAQAAQFLANMGEEE